MHGDAFGKRAVTKAQILPASHCPSTTERYFLGSYCDMKITDNLSCFQFIHQHVVSIYLLLFKTAESSLISSIHQIFSLCTTSYLQSEII